MKCGACGGFYNPNCQQWPACRPVEPDPPRRVVVRPYPVGAANYVAVFHNFNTDSKQLNNNIALYPCTIVKHKNNRIKSMHTNYVTFQEPTQ